MYPKLFNIFSGHKNLIKRAKRKRPEKMEKQKEFVLKQIETTIIFYLKRTKSTAGNQNKQPWEEEQMVKI